MMAAADVTAQSIVKVDVFLAQLELTPAIQTTLVQAAPKTASTA